MYVEASSKIEAEWSELGSASWKPPPMVHAQHLPFSKISYLYVVVLLAKIMQATLIFPEIHLAVRTSECQKGSTSAESAL